jgi:HK97 family phage major capsid protein
MTETLVSKSREANDLNGRAKVIYEKIRDDSTLTAEQFKALTEEFKVVRQRADWLSEFTAEKEIQRQGGDQTEVLERTGVSGERRVLKLDGTASMTPGASDAEREALEQDMDPEAFFPRMKKARMQIRRAFKSTHKYLRALRSSITYGECTPAQIEVLNQTQMLTRTIIGTAGDASGGEFLLPLQQEPSVFMVENEEMGLLQSARRYNVAGRTFRIPFVRQTDPSNARPISGIANVTIIGEAQTKPILEPAFAQRLLTMFKYAAASQIGDETIRDDFTGDLQPIVTALVGQQVLNAMNEHITIDGTGTGMPLGALNAGNPGLLTLNRTGGVGTKNFAPVDAFALLSYHTMGPKSVWLCSRRTIQGIYNLALTSGGTGVAWVSFLTDLRGKPGTQMLGLPIVYTDLLPTWGQSGDICLVNPDFMAVGLRQALTVESSIHVAFLQDVTTYRFFARGGGMPIPDGTYAYKSAAGTEIDPHSPFVKLM